MEADVTGGAFDEIAIVVRHTRYDTDDPEQRIALMSAFIDPVKADAEASRLNSVAPDERVTYFVKIARLMHDAES
jgi:hypothetical protein